MRKYRLVICPFKTRQNNWLVWGLFEGNERILNVPEVILGNMRRGKVCSVAQGPRQLHNPTDLLVHIHFTNTIQTLCLF